MAVAGAAVLLVSGANAPARAQTATLNLAKLQVRLWYQETGRLSDNIAPPASPILWNTIGGAGDSEEIANDALFTAQLVTVGHQFVAQQILLAATDSTGRVLAQRSYDHVLTSVAGAAVLPLWVPDVGCAGTVYFSARIGAEMGTVSIDFLCGE